MMKNLFLCLMVLAAGVLSYHFDNGSPVPTIYQDEPLNFNLCVGLRFSF